MSFGMGYVAPALPDFLARHPDVSIDLHLSDEVVDLVGGGFDCALRIAALPDSSLTARRLRPVERFLVGSPDYLAQRGRPTHPDDLSRHACLGYAYMPTPDVWRFVNDAGEEVAGHALSIVVGGSLRFGFDIVPRFHQQLPHPRCIGAGLFG